MATRSRATPSSFPGVKSKSSEECEHSAAESCSGQKLWQDYATKHGSQPSDNLMPARSISLRMPVRIGSACS